MIKGKKLPGQYGNTRDIYVYCSGSSVSGNSFLNKGTAFTLEEREKLGLTGMFPPSVRPFARQIGNSRLKVEGKQDDIERYIYIRSLFDRNVTLARPGDLSSQGPDGEHRDSLPCHPCPPAS